MLGIMMWCPPPRSHLSSVQGPFMSAIVSAIVSATITSSLIEDDEGHHHPLLLKMMKVIIVLSLALVHVKPHSSALSAFHALVKAGSGTAAVHPPDPHASIAFASIAFASIAFTSAAVVISTAAGGSESAWLVIGVHT